MDRGHLLNKKSLLAFAVLLMALFLLLVASEVARDELALFLESSAEVVPFVLLAVLAYSGEKDKRIRPLAVMWCLLLVILIALFSFGLGAMSLSGTSGLGNISWENYTKMAGLCLLAVLFSMLGFLSGFRMLCARLIPVDPWSFVHALALVMVMAITLFPL
jgi:hypothetical protein